MLANGITLSYKSGTASSGSYSVLSDLKEVPELGGDPERVDNTALGDSHRVYELGIPDTGELNYVFRFKNAVATDSFRVLKALSGVNSFKQDFPDGTSVEFTAESSVRVGGGGVNAPIDFTLALAVQSEFTWTNPTTTGSGG